jgi:hypothetical protein
MIMEWIIIRVIMATGEISVVAIWVEGIWVEDSKALEYGKSSFLRSGGSRLISLLFMYLNTEQHFILPAIKCT